MVFFWSRPHFVLVGRLYGHSEGINSLSISNDGTVLASGGSDTLRLWDIVACKELRPPFRPDHRVNVRGQVTCTSWLPTSDWRKTLIFATSVGYLIVWKESESGAFKELSAHRVGTPEQVISLSVSKPDTKSFRVALGTYERWVRVFMYDDEIPGTPTAVFSVQLAGTIPKSIAFADNVRADLIIFGMMDGRILTVHGQRGNILRSTNAFSQICGYAAFCPGRRLAVIDNSEDGFSVIDVATGSLVRALPCPVNKTVPKQVAWAHHQKLIIGGSDHGMLYVYNAETGQVTQKLQHESSGFVQTVASFDGSTETLVMGGSSTNYGSSKPYISFWRMTHSRKYPRTSWGWLDILTLAHAAFVLAFLVALLQPHVSRRLGLLLSSSLTNIDDSGDSTPNAQHELRAVRAELEQMRHLVDGMPRGGR
ncbi:hypothetical protein ACEPAF_8885 [Sanghuangporus sanghuang]